MWLTLLSTLGGGLLRLLPELLTWMHQKQADSHEMDMTRLQLQIDQARATQALDLVAAQANAAVMVTQMQGMIEAAKAEAVPLPRPIRGHWFYNFWELLAKSVRPVLTYWWCLGLYTWHKGILVVVAWQAHSPLAAYLPITFTAFDESVVGSIIGFWFMDRTLSKGCGLTTGVLGRAPGDGFTFTKG